MIEVNAPLRGRLPASPTRPGRRLSPTGRSRSCSARPSTVADDSAPEGLVMLRYDEAVFVDEAAIPSASSAYQLG